MIGMTVNRFVGLRRRGIRFRTGGMLLLFLAIFLPVHAENPVSLADGSNNVFRFVLSSKMFSEVRIEDAKAAMKVWILTVAGVRHIPIEPEPGIYDSLEEMVRASRDKPVDGFNVTTEECWRLSKEIKLDRLAVAVHNGQVTETYVLLARRDRGIKSLDDLQGRRLKVLENPRMSLAMIWLDSLLLRKGLKSAASFCGKVMPTRKLTQAVLPVFFDQSDACLVTQRGFETMGELNPQVEKQLQVIAASPEVVPNVFAFRSDYISPLREQILAEMGRLSETPAGQQILTLVQADRVEERPMACLSSAFELLSTYQSLSSAAINEKSRILR
jgi:hypothetical protein